MNRVEVVHATSFFMDTTIPKLVLDPQNESELLAQFHARTKAASNGLLNDDTVGSAQSAIGEGVVFSIAELLYFANMLPEASALEVFRLSGVSRLPGTYATGTLTFMLRAKLDTPFTLPQGYLVAFSPNNIEGEGYQLTEPLYIAPGTLQGTVAVRATAYGENFNLPALGLNLSSTSLNNCQAIYNIDRISGGSSIEDLDKTIARAQSVLRSRDVLVSQSDYETKAVELLGVPGIAKAIPWLSSDKVTKKVGQVHVFLTEADGTAPSLATCQYIQSELQQRSFVASSIWVSPIAKVPVACEVVVGVDQLSQDLAQAVYDSVQHYLSPANLGIGNDIRINKINYEIQNVYGIQDLISLRVNASSLDIAMPNPYSIPKLGLVVVTQSDTTGLSQTYYIGTGDGFTDLN